MKLTTVVIAAAVLAGAAGAAASASANAIIFDKYDYGAPGDVTSDGAVLFVENNGSVAFTDVTISGGFAGGSEDFGALAAGASTGQFYMGDNEYGPDGTALVTITIGSKSYSGSFSDVLGDIDVETAPEAIGSISVPEPATWALMLAGFAGLGAALRMSRKKPEFAT